MGERKKVQARIEADCVLVCLCVHVCVSQIEVVTDTNEQLFHATIREISHKIERLAMRTMCAVLRL